MTTRSASRATPGFWWLAIILVVYVAACTGFRDNNLEADAWEHLSVLHALTENPWHPGNPTYALDIPSVRYSPYFVGLALFCRATQVDPYSALSVAAVLNTCLLILGIWLFLASFDEAAGAAAALFVVVALYGGPPGYANSLALADLPLLAMNPSAFSLALVLISWSLFRRVAIRGLGAVPFVAITILLACAVLDHAMTGVFGLMGLFVLALAGDRAARRNTMLIAAAVAVLAVGVALAWPWYSFLTALRSNRDRDYWFNPYILELMLTTWCAPAILCTLFVLPLRDRPLVRACLLGGTLSLVVGLLAWIIRSPALARFPLAGVIYFQLAIGVFVHDSEIARPSRWRPLLQQLMSFDSATANRAIPRVTVAIFLIYFLIPQLILIAKTPNLGRKYVARITGRREKIEYPRRAMRQLLGPIGPRDVVLSDIQTSWRIPSTRGRVVAALHYELFVPDQPQRTTELNNFFSSDSEAERDALIRKYGVDWIVLNRSRLGDAEFAALLRQPAVVGTSDDGNLVLMQADRWIKAGAQQ